MNMGLILIVFFIFIVIALAFSNGLKESKKVPPIDKSYNSQTTNDIIKKEELKSYENILLKACEAPKESISKIPHYLFFDTETTGLPKERTAIILNNNNNYPSIVQLAWIVTDVDGGVIEQKDYILKQKKKIPKKAIDIHGITDEIAEKRGVIPRIALEEFYNAATKCQIVVCHNMEFDFPVAETALLNNNLSRILHSRKLICTMRSAKKYCGLINYNGNYKYPTLKELWLQCYLGNNKNKITYFSYNNAHDAASDTLLTYRCFFRMKKQEVISDKSLYRLPENWKLNNVENDLSLSTTKKVNIDLPNIIFKNPIIEDSKEKEKQFEVFLSSIDLKKFLFGFVSDKHESHYPININKFSYEYTHDNYFKLKYDYQTRNGNSSGCCFYQLRIPEDDLYEKAFLKEKNSNTIDEAILIYESILQSNIYPNLYCNTVLRLSILYRKKKEYNKDVFLLQNVLKRIIPSSSHLKSHVEILSIRLEKSIQKQKRHQQ